MLNHFFKNAYFLHTIMKKVIFLFAMAIAIVACGKKGGEANNANTTTTPADTTANHGGH